jgi:catechol 2,3-dioxygenase-like lactoylglutathione lyase family enzyme
VLDNRSMPPSAVIPVLGCPDVVAASAWLREAFGFLERLAIGSHRIQLSYGSGSLVLVDGAAVPATVMVRVQDADAHCARARAAGARIVAEPADQPYGERQYTAVDPAGHTWTFSQTIADVDPADWLS